MKIIKSGKKKFLIISIILIMLTALFFPTWTPKIKGDNSISLLKQVKINGSNHQVMIRGKDKKNQILLFVHGGPGCSEIPYVTKYQDLLEEDFTIVHYDQRASGKSYHFFENYSNLSSELLVTDLLAMTKYVSDLLGKDKVILIGHSFGTYIGLQAVSKVPEMYSAYIGIGQVSDSIDSELDSLNYCISKAEKARNTYDAKKLEKLREDIEKREVLTPRKYIRKYGGAFRLINDNDDYVKGFLFGSEYNLLDVIRYSLGVNYSQKTLLKEQFEKPLPGIVKSIKIPCYFIMGEYDYMTSTKAAKSYFNNLDADKKEFIIYENSAHYPQFEEKEKFAKWMKGL
ncbi:alpha/beta hydrolase [Clostridium simiarum]